MQPVGSSNLHICVWPRIGSRFGFVSCCVVGSDEKPRWVRNEISLFPEEYNTNPSIEQATMYGSDKLGTDITVLHICSIVLSIYCAFLTSDIELTEGGPREQRDRLASVGERQDGHDN